MAEAPEPSPPSGSPDFISAYADYADVLEAPRIMHEAVAIQLIATILNRNGVRIQHGSLQYPFDLWQVLLSRSGMGRSTLISLAEPILQESGLGDLVLRYQWGSPQAFYQDMAEHPSGLRIWGELSEKLKLLNDRAFSGVKPWLTDRYDNWGVPDAITYRDTGRRSRDTPPINFACAPRTNILAGSSEDWFFNNLVPEDSAGGFAPRYMLFRADDPQRDVPTPKQTDSTRKGPLASHLRQVAELRGVADLSKILAQYESWYREAKRRFKSQPNQALALPFFGRLRVQVLKLAVIYEVSGSLSLRVSNSSWEQAKETGSSIEKTIFELLSTGMSGEGYTVERMAHKIQSAGVAGISKSDFTRAFQHQDRRDRYHRVETLIEAEKVYRFQRRTLGRIRTTLVHADYVSEYRTKHPDELESGGADS